MGIIAAGAISAINPAKRIGQANDARRKADLNAIQKSLEQFYSDNGSYPSNTTSDNCDSGSSGGYKILGLDGSPVCWGQQWTHYMSVLPADPNSSKRYVYKSTGQAYYLYASLDLGGGDPQACNEGASCTNATGISCCKNGSNNSSCAACNYGVTSPNVSP